VFNILGETSEDYRSHAAGLVKGALMGTLYDLALYTFSLDVRVVVVRADGIHEHSSNKDVDSCFLHVVLEEECEKRRVVCAVLFEKRKHYDLGIIRGPDVEALFDVGADWDRARAVIGGFFRDKPVISRWTAPPTLPAPTLSSFTGLIGSTEATPPAPNPSFPTVATPTVTTLVSTPEVTFVAGFQLEEHSPEASERSFQAKQQRQFALFRQNFRQAELVDSAVFLTPTVRTTFLRHVSLPRHLPAFSTRSSLQFFFPVLRGGIWKGLTCFWIGSVTVPLLAVRTGMFTSFLSSRNTRTRMGSWLSVTSMLKVRLSAESTVELGSRLARGRRGRFAQLVSMWKMTW